MLTVGSLAAALADMPQDAHVVIHTGDDDTWSYAVCSVVRERVLPTTYGEMSGGPFPGYSRVSYVGDWIEDDPRSVEAIVLEGPK